MARNLEAQIAAVQLDNERLRTQAGLRTVKLGPRTLSFPSAELAQMQDSNALLNSGDFEGLRRKMAEDGFLFLRGLIPGENVRAARTHVLSGFASAGGILSPAHSPEEGVLLSRCGQGCVPFLEGQNDVTKSPIVNEGVLESPSLAGFFRSFLGEEPRSFDYKWLRAVHSGAFSGAHVDNVYMGRGTQDKLFTCWIPFGDTPCELGGLAVLKDSHRAASLARFQDTCTSHAQRRASI